LTARNDLENAFSILDAGITAHVAALKSAHAAVLDESYLQSVTAKVIAFADTLAASAPVVVAPVVPASVIVAPVAPVLTPVLAQAAQVAQVLPPFLQAPVLGTTPSAVSPAVVEPAPVEPVAFPDGKVPSVLETMEAAVKAMMAHK